MYCDAKILVVDDASTILSLVDNLFKKKHQVTKCKSVNEAIQFLGEETPDMIITDLNMPDGSGEELVSYLKSTERFDDTAVIVLSSTDSSSTKLRLLKMGVDDFVQKPFNPEELNLRAENILRRYESRVLVN